MEEDDFLNQFWRNMNEFVTKQKKVKAVGGVQKIVFNPFYVLLYDRIHQRLFANQPVQSRITLIGAEITKLNFIMGQGIYNNSGWCYCIQEGGNEDWSVVKLVLSFSIITLKLTLEIHSEARNLDTGEKLSAK